MSTINFDQFDVASELELTIDKPAPKVRAIRTEMLTVEEVKQTVHALGQFEEGKEGLKTTDWLSVLSFGTDCSPATFSARLIYVLRQSETWPVRQDGKPCNTTEARTSLAGKLYNRIYKMFSTSGIVKTLLEDGEKQVVVKMSKDDRDYLIQAICYRYELFPETSVPDKTRLGELMQSMTPSQRASFIKEVQEELEQQQRQQDQQAE